MRPNKLLLCVVVLIILMASFSFVSANVVRDIKFEVNPDNVKILIKANKPIQYTSFQSDKNWIVLDLIDCSFPTLEPVYNVNSGLLNKIKASLTKTNGHNVTRLEFSVLENVKFSVLPQDNILIVDLKRPTLKSPAKKSVIGTGVLKNITYEEGKDVFTVYLKGQNLRKFRKFRLSDPFRIVLDLKGVKCLYNKGVLRVDSDVVKNIRVSQFSRKKGGIVRVVFDLTKNVRNIDIEKLNDGLKVDIGNNVVASKAQKSFSKKIDIPVKVMAESKKPSEQSKKKIDAEFTDMNIVKIPNPVIEPKNLSRKNLSTKPVKVLGAEPKGGPSPVTFVQDDSEGQVQYTGEPITLDIKDADIVDFFRLISDIEGLNIVVDPSVSGTISMKVENVPWDQVFDLALKNNRLAKVIEGNVVRIGTMESFKREEEQRQELKRAKDTRTDIIKVNYATASNLKDKLLPLLTQSGDIKIDKRTNSIIVRDIPERIRDVRNLVKALDLPEHQVEIEARIIAASRNFARSIGVQAGFVAGNLNRVSVGGPNTFSGISGYRPSNTPKSTYAGGDSVHGRGASQTDSTENAAISVGTEGDNKRGNYNWSFPAVGATSGIGISVGNILDTFLLDASITAAESEGKVRVISQPKVQAQNNEKASIEQGIQFPVQVVENNTVTIRFFSASLKLTVVPQITDEGTVLMNITVENNRADFVNTVNGIPSIITSMSSTKVLVADGGTTVIGGILIDTEQRNIDKVPLFGDIPVIGNLFKRTTKTKESKEILFFLTPRIIR